MDTNSNLDLPKMSGNGRFELRAELSRTASTLGTLQIPQDQPMGPEQAAHPDMSQDSARENTTIPEPPARLAVHEKKGFAMQLLSLTN